jgi:hypothetical protein
MTDKAAGRTLPSLPGLIASGLVIVGLLLDTFVAEGLLAVAGLGAFGPGILRELGWLRDKDEFQRQATYRAGYHAYLIGGLVTVLIVSALRWRQPNLEVSSEWIMLILVVLWMTWLFSALMAYWGARRTASLVLIVFGSFWAVFFLAHVVGALSGPEPIQLAGVLVGFMLVAPYFVLSWTAGRWPRRTGAVLLVVSALFLVIFGPTWASGSLQLPSVLVTAALLVVPVVASGIALLREGGSDDPDRDVSDDDGAPTAY